MDENNGMRNFRPAGRTPRRYGSYRYGSYADRVLHEVFRKSMLSERIALLACNSVIAEIRSHDNAARRIMKRIMEIER